MDKGAAGVLITLPSSEPPDLVVEMLAALPRERVCLIVPWAGARDGPSALSLEAAVRLAAAPIEKAGKPLVALVGALLVNVSLPPTDTAAADGAALLAEPLRQLGKALKLKIRLGFDGLAPSVGDAGALHCADIAVHACVAVATPLGAKVTLVEPASVGAALVACARTDRADGLLTTVVVDEGGVCLGLVYSSAESVQESVRAGRGIYFSRSRNSLWRKGDTSGATQELQRIEVDCDSDALRFTVRQLGEPPAFCHLGTRTCWGEARGLHALQRTLQARLASAPAGSYSAKLFADPTLLRHKLLEEAQELIEATEPDHVAAEAADMLFFLMTRCVAAGVGLADIERHLDKRTLKVKRRPGLAKEHRVRAAEEQLGIAHARPAGKAGASGWAKLGVVVVAVGAAALLSARSLAQR
uniref:Phosphoribosyl-AMP cyclohydrolase domain-containing protein n=1 Tax=Diacronema lutheri TaxID=2081491 RepID=A0A7R9UQV6_DIALT